MAAQFLQRATLAGYRAIVLTVDSPRSGNKEMVRRLNFHLPAQRANEIDERSILNSPPLTWESVSWLRSHTSLPFLVKGILTAEDARLAVEHNFDGIIVSNHGGRQLDGVPATLEALPEIVKAVAGRCEIYLDGGIRRGTDVLKALALGARAVFVGRPILWGLSLSGTDGVISVLEIFRTELERAMALVGCSTLQNLGPSFLRMDTLKRE